MEHTLGGKYANDDEDDVDIKPKESNKYRLFQQNDKLASMLSSINKRQIYQMQITLPCFFVTQGKIQKSLLILLC